MPGLQADGVVAALGSPIKKSKLSLKFFQKKETKRALDFSETQPEEQNAQPSEAEEPASFDQVVPGPCPTSPLTCERRENLVPFVGLNNLGNTCYLNSILQVLYHCPGFKEAIKKLYKLSKCRDKQKEAIKKEEQERTEEEEQVPAQMELLGSFYSLITSVEQLQSNFLLNPDKYSEGELSTPPRKLLNSLRQLNPMYEGYLQHDAQEVLQCILAYVQEACEGICKEQQQESEPGEKKEELSTERRSSSSEDDEAGADGQMNGKRKSDTEAGNAKKKPKSQTKGRNTDEEQHQPLTRSKRKSSRSDITTADAIEHPVNGTQEEKEVEEVQEAEKEEGGGGGSEAEEGKIESAPKEAGKRKKRARLSWLKTSSGKQPSIFSKFRSMGRLSSRAESREDHGKEAASACKDTADNTTSEKTESQPEKECTPQSEEVQGFDVLKSLFQGQLVLRTRCLECECFTERREDFQDISVPVQEDEPAPRDSSSEISPEPKPEVKTLKWAISQFASVERIVGEDKYFCETCHHYTEAERSLLFDKTPEVITIHLKCFAANTSEMDLYAGLSKVNTPLQTPLRLSLEEWSTGTAPRGQPYQLFAVVMHSGVTISSGHYTTYIRMSDLRNIGLREEGAAGEEEGRLEEEKELQALKKEEAAAAATSTTTQDYDDGEVSFSLSARGSSSAPVSTAVTGAKPGVKKSLEGVGLLGGQRSLATYELGGSTKQQQASADKGGFPSGSQPLSGGVKKEKDASVAEGAQGHRGDDPALQNLLDYEGKWLLFDDSEVRLFEEEDFLRACSPDTCSTSTPYLLFYRRVAVQK